MVRCYCTITVCCVELLSLIVRVFREAGSFSKVPVKYTSDEGARDDDVGRDAWRRLGVAFVGEIADSCRLFLKEVADKSF